MFELYALFFVILAANTYFVYRSAFTQGYVAGVLDADQVQEEIEKVFAKNLQKELDKDS